MASSVAKSFEKTLSYFYDEDTAKEILVAVQTRIGERQPLTNLPLLGVGSYASVFWLPDKKKILKVTSDPEDANASTIIMHKPDKSLVKTYDVFKFPPGKLSETRLWGIVNEKLTPLDAKAQHKIQGILDVFFYSGIYDDPRHKNVKTFFEALQNPKTGPQKYIPSYMQQAGITEKDIQEIWVHWADVLEKRHIIWHDFKLANIMMRNREYVIADIGYNSSPKQAIPVLQVAD